MNESPADEKSRTTIKHNGFANKGIVQNSLTLSFQENVFGSPATSKQTCITTHTDHIA